MIYGVSNLRIMFSPKYKHDILTGRIANVCDLAFEAAGKTWNIHIVTKRINSDHVHQFVSLGPSQSPGWTVSRSFPENVTKTWLVYTNLYWFLVAFSGL
ncbi:MAG: hypothetical protein GTO45_14390 [Candidatus Aminicenantes bacterium]|nr:hypothetical protein [Candidatus Aminicenantes bacterium]NIM79955.1 hypothetical protein [Candidatus Aminicenantes bacterium]NIN19294.1 hypothetical protein [Candidatus Aminicenantes bacterium]NIN43197.1 hypothetical protein [Candidatus Aminicenantes bacterium]NIN85936.1 hypothetical protein [Candidatus Aminicenantes bacterium]